jgi:spore germination protein (amino acid permease)
MNQMAQTKPMTIPPGVLWTLVVVTLLGQDFLNQPHYAAKVCGASGYWALCISFILTIPVIFLIAAFKRRFPKQNLLDAATQVLGKPLAFISNLLFLSIFLIYASLAIRDATDLVMSYMLERTPVWVVLFVFLLGCGYITINGFSGVVRMVSFILIPTVFFRLFMQILAFQQFSVSHLLPLVTTTPVKYLQGGLLLLNGFMPVIAILLILHLIEEPRKLSATIFGAASSASLLFLLEILGTIGVFGATFLQRFTWSNLALIQRINIPYLVLEQIGPLFLVVWLTMFLCSMAFNFYLVAGGVNQLFPRWNYRLLVLILLAIVGVSGLFLPNMSLVTRIFTVYRVWAMAPLVCYPVIVYGVALIRGERGEAV